MCSVGAATFAEGNWAANVQSVGTVGKQVFRSLSWYQDK